MDNRSPLESIFGIIKGLSQGHDKPVKQALYNALALLLLTLCCAATWALFLILEPFVKPLIWALLVGSVLHPLKRSLRDKLKGWFKSLEDSHTPVIFGVLLTPINIINDLADFVGSRAIKHLVVFIWIAVPIPTILLLYNYTPAFVILVVSKTYSLFFWIFNSILENATTYLVGFILIGYLSLIILLWKPNNNTKFHYASLGIWFLLSCFFSHQCGLLQVPVFILMQIAFFGGFLSEVYNIFTELNSNGHDITFLKALSLAFHDNCQENENRDENSGSELKDAELEEPETTECHSTSPKIEEIRPLEPHVLPEMASARKSPFSLELFEVPNPNILKEKKAELDNPKVLISDKEVNLINESPEVLLRKDFKRSLSQPQFNTLKLKERSSLINYKRNISLRGSTQSMIDTEKYESTFYLYSVIWCCIAILFWKNVILIPLFSIPFLLYCIKRAGIYFGLWNWLFEQAKCVMDNAVIWCNDRHDALIPVPIRGLYKAIHKVNIIIKTNVKESIDTVSSCVVIFGLTIFLACASIFIIFQIYAEAIMLIQMTGNVINQTVVHNPELRQLLPPTWDDTVDSILDNAYQYGREGISKTVKLMMTDVDSTKSDQLEKQVLELWDRLYQSWMASDDHNGPKVTQDAVWMSWESFLGDIKKSPEMYNFNGILEFGKQNVGTLVALLESVWSIFKGNIGLLLSSFSTCISIVFGGGTAVLNFILNGIVFLTTLFYLLNSSSDLYKPIELMTKFSSNGHRFGTALEGAVKGVFAASFKMAAFYGLWTWFIHNLFGVKIVYLPSAFATILGAIPFLGTYWACFPAVLDLWLAQDRGMEAILFAVFQFLPTSIVDTTIYKEIKGGGHPYLTGLAIAGGIFCLGVEGAIIGPLLLCGLFVVMDLSSTIFKESPSEESLNLRLQL